MKSSLSRALLDLVPPPEKPEPSGGTDQLWHEFKCAYNRGFPEKWWSILCIYGIGVFHGHRDFGFYNPWEATFGDFVQQRLADLIDIRDNWGGLNLPYHPEPNGLFPIGSDDSGFELFWTERCVDCQQTEPLKDKSACYVILTPRGDRSYRFENIDLDELLVYLFSNRCEELPYGPMTFVTES